MKKANGAVVLGFDPGGSEREGNATAALVVAHGRVVEGAFAHFATVRQASVWLTDAARSRKCLGLGIDTLLAWSGGHAGWRTADLSLRAAYPGVRKSVKSPNGLRGSMCIGGPLLASYVRGPAPTLPLFETHPKVLYFALRHIKYDWEGAHVAMIAWLQELMPEAFAAAMENEDEFDAVLSAYAAFMAVSGIWTTDLLALPRRCGEELYFPVPGPPPTYPWPQQLQAACSDDD